ncbi:MAG: TolC family protein [Cyclobacteriaceae bacterium]|jgi:outer membrane protein TolC|nr:TolC family protein [Cyclobacteriaceae bacterium]
MNRNLPALALVVFSFLSASAQNITLDEVVSAALEKNYDVRVLQQTSAVAANDLRFSFGAFIPQINATGSYVKNNNNSQNITFSDVETIRNGAKSTLTNGSVQMVWTLFDGTKMFATRNRLEQLASLGEVNVRNQMMNTTANVITLYYNIVRQKQQRKAIIELMAVNEERVKLAERKLQVGSGSKPELLQAKVDLNAQRTAVLAQESLIQQLKDQLNGTLAMSLPDVYDVTDTIPIDLTLTEEEIIQGIEQTNPALLASKKNIDIANLVMKENRRSRSPILNFTSSYNYGQTENELQVSPVSQKFTKNQGYNYGLSLAVPIMNGMNVNRLVAQSKINLERAKLVYDQQKIIAMVGVRNAYVAYDNYKKALLIEEENLLLAKENVNIALAGFRRGIYTFIELRTAQQSLADAYSRLIAARYNAKVSETELLRLKGSLLK